MFINNKSQTKLLICLIIVINVNQLLSQNIGCIDPNNPITMKTRKSDIFLELLKEALNATRMDGRIQLYWY